MERTGSRQASPSLRRALGPWSAGAILVGTVIGSGIFRVPATVAAELPVPWLMQGVWLAGALFALAGALSLAELATMYPRPGGVYVYLREAWGDLPAFCFGWTQFVLVRPASLAAIALIFAEAAADVLGTGDAAVRGIAVVAIAVVGAVNVRSVGWGAALATWTTGAKVATLLGLAALLHLLAPGPAPSEAAATGTAVAGFGWAAFGTALVAVMWAYEGWDDLTMMAGEVRSPARTLPQALTGGLVVVGVVYLLVNAGFLRALGPSGLAASPLPAADAIASATGGSGRRVVALLVMISTLGSLNGTLMTGPRVFFAMAADRVLPGTLAAVHPRWGTPWAALLFTTLMAVLYASAETFETLAGVFVLGMWPFYVLAVLAVPRLRRVRPHVPRPYAVPLYPWVPLAFFVASLGMLWAAAVRSPMLTGVSLAVILSGVPLFWLWRRTGPRSRTD